MKCNNMICDTIHDNTFSSAVWGAEGGEVELNWGCLGRSIYACLDGVHHIMILV